MDTRIDSTFIDFHGLLLVKCGTTVERYKKMKSRVGITTLINETS